MQPLATKEESMIGKSEDKPRISIRRRKVNSWLLVIVLLGPFILNLFYAPTKNFWIKLSSSAWLGVEATLIGLLLLVATKPVLDWLDSYFLLSSSMPDVSDWTLSYRLRLITVSVFILVIGIIFLAASAINLMVYIQTGNWPV